MKFSLLGAIALFAAAAIGQTNNTIADINGRTRTLQEDYEVDDGELNRECHTRCVEQSPPRPTSTVLH
ncbi:hypothetical protein H257_14722 [Aphanomyces astaci]|uniref:RxLR effector protein n=1 Tax=Aphanomyces astaci TaxID=112090 RepID=W4FRL8_APHAT|nr:hypothetical protein H257_14722 [Aphanomyces astaci]ETV69586.1 hypothetical protein H257_14722 [Aphanomyces astaci]|eukprot:XP_009840913.1 hypothetical protein H257_14722 [Aphanomyces astaci]